MARKLMTFVPSLGFYNQAIGAPSMKAALEDVRAPTESLSPRRRQADPDGPDIVSATMAAPATPFVRANDMFDLPSGSGFSECRDVASGLGPVRRRLSATRRTFAVFDHDRFRPEYDIAEHMPVRRFDGMADGEVRIAPVAPEDFVPRGDVPGLFFRVRGYDGHLAARPTKVGTRRQSEQRCRLADVDVLCQT
jgi:hypothetical protein